MKNVQPSLSSFFPNARNGKGKQRPKKTNSFFRCPYCQAVINPDYFEIFDCTPNGMMYIVQCRSCHYSLYGSFVLTPDGMNSVGILTDLTKEDILKFQHQEPISSDDVLVLYEMWKRPAS